MNIVGNNLEGSLSIMRKHRYFLTIIFLCSGFYYFGSFGKTVIDSLGTIMIPVIVLISYMIFIRKFSFCKKNFLLVIISSFLVLFCYIFVGGGLGSVINNLSAIVFVLIFYEIEIEVREYQYFAKLVLVFQVYLIGYCLVHGLENGYIGIYNSNTIGMQILFNLIFIDMYIGDKKKQGTLLINVVSILLILFTKSRTSLIIGLLLLLLMLINRKKMLAPKLFKIGFWLLAFLGLYFPTLYVNLFLNSNTIIYRLFNQFSVQYFNKNLFTGREYIWMEAIEQINGSWTNLLFGIGSHYGGDIGSNFHNSYFTIVICSGLIVYILFIFLLYRFFKRGNFSTRSIQRSRLMYLAIMIFGFSESVLFSGQFAILAYLLLCVSNSYNLSEDLE